MFQFKENLVTRNKLPADFLRDAPPLEVVFAIAVVGLLLSIYRRNRLGIALGMAALAMALALIHRPEGVCGTAACALLYLSLYLLGHRVHRSPAAGPREALGPLLQPRYTLVGSSSSRPNARGARGGLFVRHACRAACCRAHTGSVGAFLVAVLAGVLWARRSTAAVLASVFGFASMAALSLPEAWWRSAPGAHGFFDVAGESVLRPGTYAVLRTLGVPAGYVLIGMVVFGLVDLVSDVSYVAGRRPAHVVQLAGAPVLFLMIFVVFAPALRSVPGSSGALRPTAATSGACRAGSAREGHQLPPGLVEVELRGLRAQGAVGCVGGLPRVLRPRRDGRGHRRRPGVRLRPVWDYGSRLDRYGTPMAPMLLPFWTDGCMGSMEGLYFEASSTTPYHFLNQRALRSRSSPQRDLPYGPASTSTSASSSSRRWGSVLLHVPRRGRTRRTCPPDLTPIGPPECGTVFAVAARQPAHTSPVLYARPRAGGRARRPRFSDPTEWVVLWRRRGPRAGQARGRAARSR